MFLKPRSFVPETPNLTEFLKPRIDSAIPNTPNPLDSIPETPNMIR